MAQNKPLSQKALVAIIGFVAGVITVVLVVLATR
jgi:hypothetical protein